MKLTIFKESGVFKLIIAPALKQRIGSAQLPAFIDQVIRDCRPLKLLEAERIEFHVSDNNRENLSLSGVCELQDENNDSVHPVISAVCDTLLQALSSKDTPSPSAPQFELSRWCDTLESIQTYLLSVGHTDFSRVLAQNNEHLPLSRLLDFAVDNEMERVIADELSAHAHDLFGDVTSLHQVFFLLIDAGQSVKSEDEENVFLLLAPLLIGLGTLLNTHKHHEILPLLGDKADPGLCGILLAILSKSASTKTLLPTLSYQGGDLSLLLKTLKQASSHE